jgi:UDP-N-acetylmuramoylalanine--D-glutamate ligase
VLSPGIPIDHPIAVAFKRGGKGVISECELAARRMRNPLIAVTGTNGKTTTVSMLTKILKKGGLNAVACGNIGTPILEKIDENSDDIMVAEISSFQLETLSSHCPHIAMILNVTEDHLNRHYTMENYIFLKKKLLKNLTETEYAILNYDDLTVRSFAEKTRAKVLYFSLKERVRGAYLEKGDLYFGKEKIMSADEVSIGGAHNLQNALASIIAAKIMGINSTDIAAALSSFKGVNHRIQTVAKAGEIIFVDDSKGTNMDATLKAVAAMKTDTILLLGGKDKGYNYNVLFAELNKSCVTHAVLYGENRYALLQSARAVGFDNVSVCMHFGVAVRLAAMQAKRGQTVLLSPASASFDEFANYEERGDKFIEIVREFAQKQEHDHDENVENNVHGETIEEG